MIALLLAALLTAPLQALADPAPARFVVTPESVRQKVLTDNYNILGSLNQLHQAKEVVNRDRGNLLPSLNVGLSITAGNFIVSSMSALLPFLMPSRWFGYGQDEALYDAQKAAYHATELNVYAQAYALYLTVAGYEQIRDIYQQEYEDYKRIEEIQSEGYALRAVTLHDLLQARAAADRALALVNQWNRSVASSRAALRATLNLPLSTELVITPSGLEPLRWENLPAETVAQEAIRKAPEIAQLEALEKAAVNGRWSTTFSFIGNFAINAGAQPGQGPQSVSFGDSTVSLASGTSNGNPALGFGTYPSIRLSEQSRQSIVLQRGALELSQRQTMESALQAIRALREQVANATAAENNLKSVYEIERESWSLGSEPLYQLLLTHVQMTDAGVSRVNATIDLNTQRITLYRALLEGEFAAIPGCSPQIPQESGLAGWLQSLFGDGGIESIDQACHPAGPALPR